MIYVTGDCHGEFERFKTRIFPEQKNMTKDDFVIICGDFGGVWMKEETGEERHLLNWLDNKSFTTLFVDGNHENFDRLEQYPEKLWNGGRVHEIRPSVLHLMRGEIFNISGFRFFTFGGAASHDMDGGILEPDDPYFKIKKKKLERQRKFFRVNHVSWWERELPSEEEIRHARENLEKVGWNVDYIITHCAPTSVQNRVQKLIGAEDAYKTDMLTNFLEEVHARCAYKYWFFGHYHDERNVSEKDKLLYEQIVRIA